MTRWSLWVHVVAVMWVCHTGLLLYTFWGQLYQWLPFLIVTAVPPFVVGRETVLAALRRDKEAE